MQDLADTPTDRPKLKREYTLHRCPLMRHNISWCRGLCVPSDGNGLCGRIAPHAMLGRTQRAILAHNARRAEESEAS